MGKGNSYVAVNNKRNKRISKKASKANSKFKIQKSLMLVAETTRECEKTIELELKKSITSSKSHVKTR